MKGLRIGHPHYGVSPGRKSIPPEHADFMRRRVGYLATFSASDTPLIDLLANAYLWGLADATETLSPRGDPK